MYPINPKVTEVKVSNRNPRLGELTRFTFKFSRPVVNDRMRLELLDDLNNSLSSGVILTMVEGSEGYEYYYDYKVVQSGFENKIRARITNITDIYGSKGATYSSDYLCTINTKKPIISTVKPDKYIVKSGEELILNIVADEELFMGNSIYFYSGSSLIGQGSLVKIDKYEYTANISLESTNTSEIRIEIPSIIDSMGMLRTYIEEDVFVLKGNSEVFGKKDFNKDDRVDILDLSLQSVKYNKIYNDLEWDSNYDINNDNIVDLYDFVCVAKKVH